MDYFKQLNHIFSRVEAKNRKGQALVFNSAVAAVVKLIKAAGKKGNKVIFIGNGGSASIASHIAIDFLKNAKIPALCFNDSSLLTCISNDLGYEYVFQKPVEYLAKKGDILFAISSSGRSRNILNAALKARQKGCLIITFSGFRSNNPLRKMGDFNFYAPADSYGAVEITHLAICHIIADILFDG